MNIYIIGSMAFAREMLESRERLSSLGHDATVPPDTEFFLEGGLTTDDHEADLRHCLETDVMRESYRIIEKTDAILVLNYPKHGLDGYIGAATLMEIGLAYHFGKKIFLLYPPPGLHQARYSHELAIIGPTVLNGNLSLIGRHSSPEIILATKSPYRQEFFRNLGLDFAVEGSGVDERFEGRPGSPEELVKELAKRKAESIAKNHSHGIVIGFDSVGSLDGQILEKPESREEAFQRLKRLSGKTYRFVTGIHMIDAGTSRKLSKTVTTEIVAREYSDSEIIRFLDQDADGMYRTVALGYDPFGHYSASFTREIRGSHFNYLQGLPIETIVEMLKEMGYGV